MFVTVENAALEVVSAYVSKNRVPLEERIGEFVNEKKISRLKKGTGFEAFSIADKDICTSDLCAASAEKIFAETDIQRKDICATIFITQTPDYFFPSTSHVLQHRLGLPRESLAFDVNLGCSGFVYGLYIATSLVQNLNGKVLLMCGDIAARNVVAGGVAGLSVFGDAGTAAIISKRPAQKIFFNIQTFGELYETIILSRGAYRNPLIVKDNSINLPENFATMDGAGVADFSIKFVPPNLRDLLNFAQVDASKIGGFFLHQANRLMLLDVAKQLDVPAEKFPFKSERIGNTSSASIPVTFCEMERLGEPINFLAVLSGFGVGMSIASAVIDLTGLKCLPTGEM